MELQESMPQYIPDLRSHRDVGRLRAGAENLEGTSYETFSYMKSSSIFLLALSAIFWLFYPLHHYLSMKEGSLFCFVL
jgi:hypothetical protein